MLLKKDVSPYWLVFPMAIIEIFSLVCIINPSDFDTIGVLALNISTNSWLIPLALVVLACVKILFNVSMVRCVYITVLYAAFKVNSIGTVATNLSLVLILLMADFVSNSEYSFYSLNRLNERYNIMKVFHYGAVILIIATLNLNYIPGPW